MSNSPKCYKIKVAVPNAFLLWKDFATYYMHMFKKWKIPKVLIWNSWCSIYQLFLWDMDCQTVMYRQVVSGGTCPMCDRRKAPSSLLMVFVPCFLILIVSFIQLLSCTFKSFFFVVFYLIILFSKFVFSKSSLCRLQLYSDTYLRILKGIKVINKIIIIKEIHSPRYH